MGGSKREPEFLCEHCGKPCRLCHMLAAEKASALADVEAMQGLVRRVMDRANEIGPNGEAMVQYHSLENEGVIFIGSDDAEKAWNDALDLAIRVIEKREKGWQTIYSETGMRHAGARSLEANHAARALRELKRKGQAKSDAGNREK